MNLNTPIQEIPRVGPQYQKRLKRLGIKKVKDILFHFPHRYEDFSNLIPIAEAQEGGPFSFQGEILNVKNISTFRKRMVLTQATVGDQTGQLKIVWFNQPYLISVFKKGDYVCLAGKVVKKSGSKYLSNPSYEKINSAPGINNYQLTHTGGLIPVYPETEGLSSRWLRFIVKPILLKLKDQLKEPLPQNLLQKFDFLPIKEAAWQIHFPDSIKLADKARERFAFEELFNLSLFVQRERLKLAKEEAPVIPLDLNLTKRFVKNLPFQLTDAQKKAVWQILKDLEKSRPMSRLLEGDVGSGKTVVATIAVLNTAKADFQAALMAPTEILAKQHYGTMRKFLEKFKIKIGLVTGQESHYQGKKLKREELLKKLKKNEVNILIGTHALIREEINFAKLALVILDEQHRFGVEQRAKLITSANSSQTDFLQEAKRKIPHLLSMTATPIPRTLSLTVYGDLDLSVLDQLPPGRKKIITKMVKPQDKKEVYNFIREKIKEGRQAFVICPRIEPSSAFQKSNFGQAEIIKNSRKLSWLEVKAVKEEYEKLSKTVFPDLKIAMLHGRMKTLEKEEAMKNFQEKKVDILVSTSVVEVGVDIPNATIMVIEGADKFGLAQLHQFRGRVGRSNFQSFCFLFTDNPGITTNLRLKALVTCENGFELAEKDLQIRGPGDFAGQRQWGIPDLAMSSLKDISLVEKTRGSAKEILQEDPGLVKHPLLRERLNEFRERIHLE